MNTQIPVYNIIPTMNAVVIRLMDDGKIFIHIECVDNKKKERLLYLGQIVSKLTQENES